MWSCVNCISGSKVVCERRGADVSSTDVQERQVSSVVTVTCEWSGLCVVLLDDTSNGWYGAAV